MNYVTTTMCGSCAVEGAMKYAFMGYAAQKRGGAAELPNSEELTSCMRNMAPGSPNYAVLSLKNGFHGTLLGSLSATRFNPLRKADIPAFDWPVAEPPQYRYPLEDNAEVNRKSEEASLADIRAKIE